VSYARKFVKNRTGPRGGGVGSGGNMKNCIQDGKANLLSYYQVTNPVSPPPPPLSESNPLAPKNFMSSNSK